MAQPGACLIAEEFFMKEELFMKSHFSTLAPVIIALALTTAASRLNAQITNPIRAHINHSFMVGDKTLPPGDYTFRIEGNSDLGVMTVQSGNGDNVAQFNVRQSIDSRTPKHSELVFKRYGNAEFLSKVYESGSKSGVSVTDTSKEETRMMKEGERAIEHTEEQP
jgi:hypothetical protein